MSRGSIASPGGSSSRQPESFPFEPQGAPVEFREKLLFSPSTFREDFGLGACRWLTCRTSRVEVYLPTTRAREFLQAYPTPEAVTALTPRQWQRWARAHRLSEARTRELWDGLQQPQLPVPAHVVRAKVRLMQTLVAQLTPAVAAVEHYREAFEDFFAGMPAAQWIRTLPIGERASWLQRSGPAWGTPPGGGSRFGICRRRPAPCP